MLQRLPRDVLTLVIKQLTDTVDRKHMSEVSKSLYDFSVPYLYESIVVEPPHGEENLEEIDIAPFRLARERGCMLYTRDLKITSRFDKSLRVRCPHHTKAGWYSPEDYRNDGIAGTLMPLLEAFEDGKIRSLNWNLGICIPKSILGVSGYFPLRQTNIETLRLVTDWSCPDSNIALDLASFPHLKRLSWVGLCPDAQATALAAALARTSYQLVELDLDLRYDGNSEVSSQVQQDDPLFARDLLGIPGRRIKNFNALKVLSLAAVSLIPSGIGIRDSSNSSNHEELHDRNKHVVKQISNVFDFSKIQSLKLRFCPGWQELLDLLTQYPRLVRLKSLEILSTKEDNGRGQSITRFLESFKGLEDLFLCTSISHNPLDIWRSALHHKATLRRIVHHQREMDTDDESDQFENYFDLQNLSFFPEDLARLCANPSQNPLSELELTSVGLCSAPEYMKPITSAFVGKNTLEVLHMRQSGPDFEHCESFSEYEEEEDVEFEKVGLGPRPSFVDFADWAFGPTGILSLRVLAFGDFSYNGRFGRHNLLLCRKEQPARAVTRSVQHRYFRSMTIYDEDLWKLFKEHYDVLKACPVDTLFEAKR